MLRRGIFVAFSFIMDIVLGRSRVLRIVLRPVNAARLDQLRRKVGWLFDREG
jgi:hypothetical protein